MTRATVLALLILTLLTASLAVAAPADAGWTWDEAPSA